MNIREYIIPAFRRRSSNACFWLKNASGMKGPCSLPSISNREILAIAGPGIEIAAFNIRRLSISELVRQIIAE